jgi:hypothetical protein
MYVGLLGLVGEVQPLAYIYVLQPLVSIEQSFSLSNSYDTCFLESSHPYQMYYTINNFEHCH